MRTPVAFMIFNRPDLTERVFAAIAEARPPVLLVISDGPRPGREGEAEKVAAARAVVERVDWPCQVLTNYAAANLGCAYRPSSGLKWVFEQVEEAIVLEDDCVPDPAFFRYCDEVLEQYRDDERVMHVSGNQLVTRPRPVPYSYRFSRYPLSWGWATWRRAFRHYDFEMTLWPSLRETGWLADLLGDERAADHWRRIFDATHGDVAKVNTWDFQWVFACWAHNGLAILPEVNLVENIGFREDATHTTREPGWRGALQTGGLRFPLAHPPCMARDPEADRAVFEGVVAPRSRPGFAERVRHRVGRALPRSVRESLALWRPRLEAAARRVSS